MAKTRSEAFHQTTVGVDWTVTLQIISRDRSLKSIVNSDVIRLILRELNMWYVVTVV